MPYTHLTERERYVISHLNGSGISIREIARRLGRSHTTISRELARNGHPSMRYWYTSTHPKAVERKSIPRHKRKQNNKRLMRYVERRLSRKWSPEQIAYRLLRDYPDDDSMRICSEAIYRWVYQEAAKGGQQYYDLRRARKRRRKQSGYGTGRGLIVDRRPINTRPECVNKKSRYGDWEGDTIIGKQGTGAIVTAIERKSLYLVAGKLVNKEAINLSRVTNKKLHRIPPQLKQTMTVDNGKEFADFKAIEKQTGMTVYFADPYSSQQRGCNENVNGLLRQYFPKGMDFKLISEKDVAIAVRCLNNRPRKSLGYRTPAEVFYSIKDGAL